MHGDQSSNNCQGGEHLETWLEGKMVSPQGVVWPSGEPERLGYLQRPTIEDADGRSTSVDCQGRGDGGTLSIRRWAYHMKKKVNKGYYM